MIREAGMLVQKTVRAAMSMEMSVAAKARQELTQNAKADSAKVKNAARQEAAKASQRIGEKSKQFVQSAYTVSIKGKQATPQPNLSGMSAPLREYMRFQNAK